MLTLEEDFEEQSNEESSCKLPQKRQTKTIKDDMSSF